MAPTRLAHMAAEAHPAAEVRWTNPSVLALAGSSDPLAVITDRARKLLYAALDAGLTGPPVDPFELAKLLGLPLHARADVADARISPQDIALQRKPAPLAEYLAASPPLIIEYNPTRPRGRLRYSVAHEIAHALFPDVGETVRHRTGTGALPSSDASDSWQLELLCNIAAAELLMPVEAVAGMLDIDPDIDFLMAQRARLDVSTEALLRRIVYGTHRHLALVATSRAADSVKSTLRVEYVVASSAWIPAVKRGALLDPSSPFGEPTAVGQTSRGEHAIAGEDVRVQVVGVPPYPGKSFPRVLGLIEPATAPSTAPEGIHYAAGDVSRAIAGGPILIAHIVSDSARSWSRQGVARSLAEAYPQARDAFRAWAVASRDNLKLGNVHVVDVGHQEPVLIASMVAQQGYGRSSAPRLVYSALAQTLEKVADVATKINASVHLPRLGAGQAGGRWDVIEQEISQSLASRGLSVTVYTPPQRKARIGI